jgi:hypothetical protein
MSGSTVTAESETTTTETEVEKEETVTAGSATTTTETEVEKEETVTAGSATTTTETEVEKEETVTAGSATTTTETEVEKETEKNTVEEKTENPISQRNTDFIKTQEKLNELKLKLRMLLGEKSNQTIPKIVTKQEKTTKIEKKQIENQNQKKKNNKSKKINKSLNSKKTSEEVLNYDTIKTQRNDTIIFNKETTTNNIYNKDNKPKYRYYTCNDF